MIESLPDEPMAALLTAMTVIEALSLQLSPCRVLAYRESLPRGLLGAYISVVGQGRRFQIALLTDAVGCRTLSSLIAGVERIDGEVSIRDREVLCDVASRVGQAFVACVAGCTLLPGLPLFAEGNVYAPETHKVQAADVALGSTRALLALLSSRESVGVASGGH